MKTTIMLDTGEEIEVMSPREYCMVLSIAGKARVQLCPFEARALILALTASLELLNAPS